MVKTGEVLQYGDEPSPTRSGVLVRLSHPRIRIGPILRLAYLGDPTEAERLLDHSTRHYRPHSLRNDPAERATAVLADAVHRVAELGASWMAAGFVQAVLNTDDINTTRESFDCGSWRLLPAYDRKFAAADFDYDGLYAYGLQSDILLSNLVRLTERLLPLSEAGAEAASMAARALRIIVVLRSILEEGERHR